MYKPINDKFSFSLVELMVVIAIIGILSAIAVPSYRNYIITSRIASGINILDNSINKVILDYDTNGTFPNPLEIYGVILSQSSTVTINAPPIVQILYNYYTANDSVHVCIYFSDIGIPGYVANTTNSNNGTYNILCAAAILQNNIFKKACGNWGIGQTMDIPIKYLPTGCNCAHLYNFATGGSC